MKIAVGDKIKMPCPCYEWCVDELRGGEHWQDSGVRIGKDEHGNYFLGAVEYEILAIVELPDNLQTRVIFDRRFYDDENSHWFHYISAKMVTMRTFRRYLKQQYTDPDQ